MDDNLINNQIDVTVGNYIKDIITKHYNSYEKLANGDVRILLNLEIVYLDIKNNLPIIIDRLADKFKIADKDAMFKLFINNIYSADVKEAFLETNKIIPGNLIKIESVEKIKTQNIIYVYEQIFSILFSQQIIDFIKYYSSFWLIFIYHIKNIFRKWKMLLGIFIFLVCFYYLIKTQICKKSSENEI
jgi:hypothetical protein